MSEGTKEVLLRGPDRRVVRLCASGSFLLYLFRALREEPGTVRCLTELPEDAKVVGVKVRGDYKLNTLDIFVESEEFDPVPHGTDVPEKGIWLTRIEPGEEPDSEEDC